MATPLSTEPNELDRSRKAAIDEMKGLVADETARLALEAAINGNFDRKAARLRRLRVRRVKKSAGSVVRRPD